MRLALALFDLLTALTMSPRRWLTRRARRYRLAAVAVFGLLFVASVDRALVLPRYDGWIGLGALFLATVLVVAMAWRWMANEEMDVPARWKARPR